MTCRPFDAIEAQRLGMINRVVPLDRLRAETDELAASLAAKPVSLLRMTKRQVHVAAEDLLTTRSGWAASAHLAVDPRTDTGRHKTTPTSARRRSSNESSIGQA